MAKHNLTVPLHWLKLYSRHPNWGEARAYRRQQAAIALHWTRAHLSRHPMPGHPRHLPFAHYLSLAAYRRAGFLR